MHLSRPPRSSREDRRKFNQGLPVPVLGGLLPEEASELRAGATSGDLQDDFYDSNAAGEGEGWGG